jgi:PAS domain S-box-containing protein
MTDLSHSDTAPLLPEEELESAFALIDLPAAMIDRSGVLVWANHAVADLLGGRVGDSFVEVLPDELHDRARAGLARTLRGAMATTHRFDLLGRDGRRFNAVVRSSPVHRDGSVVGVLGIVIPMGTLQVCARDGGRALTPRQEQVLRLLAEGLATDEIADRMGVALETARNHIRGLLSRLEVHSRLGAVLEGLRRGVLDLDELD